MAITIIGAGISGLVLGRCLLARGIRAVLLEKSRPSTNRNNYGITLHRHAYQALLKVLDLDETAFKQRTAVDAAVGGTGRIKGGDDEGSFRANRNSFEGLLAEGLDVRWEREVEGVEGKMVKVKGEDVVESEVVVGADGPHSIVRRGVVAPEVEFEVLPFAVYNGKRRVSKEEFEGVIELGLEGGNVLEQRVGDVVFQVSVSERTGEGVGLSYVYSRPARVGEDFLFRPEREKGEAKQIPETLFEEVDNVKDKLGRPLSFVFDTAKMRDDRLLNWLMRTIHVDGERLIDGSKKGIVLMGDAVHAEPILGGEGANVAIEDGMRLASFLLEENAGHIQQFYRERLDIWRKGVTDSKARISSMHGTTRPSL